MKGLKFLGFVLDENANKTKARKISAEEGRIALVMPTNEEIMIARETADIIRNINE